jgi:small subunit ribosomal protein S1
MNLEPSQDQPSFLNQDNAFWDALFTQENGNTSSTEPELEPVSEEAVENGRSHPIQHHPTPWELAQKAHDNEQKLRLTVTGYNKGGLLVYWHGLPGFVPASQLIHFPQFHVASKRTEILEESVGKVLTLRIIEVNPKSNRLILSERAAQVEARQQHSILASIHPGDTLTGHITNLTDFGAFVDLGGVEGLIHISELSWSRVPHPSKIVRPNDLVTVLVLGVDRDNKRVALSLKQLHPDPWQTAETRYQPGQIVEGEISQIVNYGAFVLLEPELEGLVHISELAEGDFLHPRNVVSLGDKVKARVLQVDSKAKRLALSMRLTE